MYKHVLVPLDGSQLAECVLPHLRTIAVGCEVVKVTLVRVIAPLHIAGGLEARIPPEEREHIEKLSDENAKQYLEEVVSSLKEAGVAAEAVILHGEIVEQLVNYANNNDVDLMIVSTHGRSGISRWVWGSVTDRILHASCVPILMVRAPGCVPGM